MTRFEALLGETAELIGQHLARLVRDTYPRQLAEPVGYALEGGKRVRGFLVMESARMHGIGRQSALGCALAVECMHSYSLVHDDLPCMDNDDLRRGRPTLHVKWNEATAVLAGDALQSLAFEALLDPERIENADVRATLALQLARAAGISGMAGGQALDIHAEEAGARMTIEQVIDLQQRKTGALICWSAEAGALLAGRDPTAMRDYARALGLAYQIADDLLDHSGSTEALGKKAGKDRDAGKATLVDLIGERRAREQARELVQGAREALEPYGAQADSLRQVLEFAITRNR